MDSVAFLENRLQALTLDAYEIYSIEKKVMNVEAKDGAIDSLDEAVEKGLSVRLFRGGKCGFACVSESPTPFLERMVELAYNSLNVVEESERLVLPGEARDDGIGRSTTGGKSREEKFQLAVDLERFARAADRRITRGRDASYSEETATVRIKNSKGLDREHERFRSELSLMVMAEE